MFLRLQSKYYRTIVLPKQHIIIIIITDQWCPDGERARALILVPSRVSPGFMSLRPGAECGSARLDSNSPSLLHPPFPYYHTHSSSSHSHIRLEKQTCIRINTERETHTYTHSLFTPSIILCHPKQGTTGPSATPYQKSSGPSEGPIEEKYRG